jgi:hypothetical protein
MVRELGEPVRQQVVLDAGQGRNTFCVTHETTVAPRDWLVIGEVDADRPSRRAISRPPAVASMQERDLLARQSRLGPGNSASARILVLDESSRNDSCHAGAARVVVEIDPKSGAVHDRRTQR